ncbi:Phage virion morphogenesis protein [Ferriphaselus amnicola]|uniref:Phage virion morphogenesis protein n=1 Tax=Ferriphaselus amnicola TaxID=1188319 RepID=A0A2Z6GCU0_9PROT|nr:phage virion morphogenesis protein [Ferriphaselus amnicola]BBE51139.1 Phage virion morphogenesis protein [Ferriphaselus amnicola]
MSDLAPLDAALSGLIQNLTATQRRQLAREIAKRLREVQAKRIAAQLDPDGTPFTPRKPQQRLRGQKGALRRTMFSKLRLARNLKAESSPDSAVVGFVSRVQAIARVHHYGLRDKVNRRRSNLEVQYPQRRLLGIADREVELVGDLVLAHLAR